MKTVDTLIKEKDRITKLGRPGVLIRPTVMPFFYTMTIADGTEPEPNFPEMQNTDLVEFHIETDGKVTITSNFLRQLSGSGNLVVDGSFGLVVPQGYFFPVDMVPRFKAANASGASRDLIFYGWLAARSVA